MLEYWKDGMLEEWNIARLPAYTANSSPLASRNLLHPRTGARRQHSGIPLFQFSIIPFLPFFTVSLLPVRARQKLPAPEKSRISLRIPARSAGHPSTVRGQAL